MATIPPKRRLVRAVLAAVVFVLVVSGAVIAIGYQQPSLGSGEVKAPANGTTVVASQGWHALGRTLSGRPARLAALGPQANVKWEYNGPNNTTNWFYDVDQLSDGNLLVENPNPNGSVVYEYDPQNRTRLWTEHLPLSDIHDVDLINGDELLVAGIDYDTGSTSNDSVFVYNRTTKNVTWRFRFKNHYQDSIAGGVDTKDWTHVNDVDKVGSNEFLVSPREFDQVIRINRSTKKIDMRLGKDENHRTLYEQHNPDYSVSQNGTPTILVADSENDRVIEYERVGTNGTTEITTSASRTNTTGSHVPNGNWKRTWVLSGGLNWPRDADRLPNGNTLITDTLNNRVIEVTPTGKVVWEAFVPWATYDAERLRPTTSITGPNRSLSGSTGPTMTDRNVTGSYHIHGSSDIGTTGIAPLPAIVDGVPRWVPFASSIKWYAGRWYHTAPWVTPQWLPTLSATLIGLGLLVAVVWGVGEVILRREWVRRFRNWVRVRWLSRA